MKRVNKIFAPLLVLVINVIMVLFTPALGSELAQEEYVEVEYEYPK